MPLNVIHSTSTQAAASTDADNEVRHLTSLTDDNNDDDNNSDATAATSARILPIRRAQSVQVAAGPPEIPPLRDITPAEHRSANRKWRMTIFVVILHNAGN